MMSDELEQALHRARELTLSAKYEMITVDILLLALMQDRDAVEVLSGLNVDCLTVTKALTAHLLEDIDSRIIEPEPVPTQGFQRVLRRASLHAQHAGKKEVCGSDILVSLLAEEETYGVYLLAEQGDTTRCHKFSVPWHRP